MASPVPLWVKKTKQKITKKHTPPLKLLAFPTLIQQVKTESKRKFSVLQFKLNVLRNLIRFCVAVCCWKPLSHDGFKEHHDKELQLYKSANHQRFLYTAFTIYTVPILVVSLLNITMWITFKISIHAPYIHIYCKLILFIAPTSTRYIN